MPLVRTPEAGAGVHVKPGTYTVRCMDATEDKLENSQFGTGEVIRFVLEFADMEDEHGNPQRIDALANDKLTPKAKLWGWLIAFGIDPQVGQRLDIEEVIDREALAKIIDRDPDAGGNVYSKVDDLMALPKGKAAGGAATVTGPALIKPDGTIEWTVFWAEVKKFGGTRESVINYVGGDIDEFIKRDPFDVAVTLEEMKARAGVADRATDMKSDNSH